MPRVDSLSPTEFAARWPPGREHSDVILLDVREPTEVAAAALDFALHIPMQQIPQRLGEIDPRKTVVVMCHGGARSLRVAEYLAANGFDNVMNLSGGIDAWSREVDDSIPRY